jgi:inner membrane protein
MREAYFQRYFMPTIISHAAIPLALGLGLGPRIIPRKLLLAGMVCAMLPDADVVAFRVGIAYEEALGHRGVSHSLLFAALVGLLAAWSARSFKAARVTAFLFIFVATASHGLLDMCTSGGLGVALLWPWTDARFFFPWRPIRVSPLSLQALFTSRGVALAWSELRWIWLPAAVCSVALYYSVRRRNR